jgi:hypothetical protein
VVFQKLFSNVYTEKSDVLQEMCGLYGDDPNLVVLGSNIFVRWVATRLCEKNLKIIVEGLTLLVLIFSQDQISVQELEVILPLILWSIDSKPSQIVDVSLDLLFMLRYHSDASDYSAILRSSVDICGVQALVHLFGELQYCVGDDSRNPAIFMEIAGYVDHKCAEVSVACGGALSMLARTMTDNAKTALLDSMSADQRDAISAVIPIEQPNSVDFDGFNDLESLEKIKMCRSLLEKLGFSAVSIQPSADSILCPLLQELCCQETDWSAMKLVLFSLYNLLIYLDFQYPDLKKALLSVTFFANRWQRKLVLMDGMSQTINAILFKIFHKTHPLQLYATLLEGMSHFRGSVPIDSFYCRCWVAITNHLSELMPSSDNAKIIAMATDSLNQFGLEDTRGKLCNALILTLIGRRGEKRIKRSPSPLLKVRTLNRGCEGDGDGCGEKGKVREDGAAKMDLKQRLSLLRNRFRDGQ